jgi:predicted glycosyltransferase
MGEAGSRPSLLLYCQHVLGMGHLVRSLALAESLAARFHVVFLNGGPVPHGVPRPRGIDFVDLPPVGFDPTGRLVSRDGRRSPERALSLRRERILMTFHRLRPRAVVVELFPFGRKKFASELLALFDAVYAAGHERPLLVSSLRDILVTGRRDQERHDERACTLANRFLDAVLVHADPRFARLEHSFRPAGRLRVPVHYTGFVTTGPSPVPSPTHRLIVSAGGGLVGARLFHAAVEAHALLFERDGLHTLLVAGPFLPEADWQALRESARGRPGLALRRSVPSLEAELARATVSVSQCGYNAALEILRTRVRALVVPFSEGGEDEQRVRARRLERLGAVRVLEPEQVDGPTLAAEVRALLHFTPHPVALDMDGAARTADLLEALLATHEGSRTLDYGMA